MERHYSAQTHLPGSSLVSNNALPCAPCSTLLRPKVAIICPMRFGCEVLELLLIDLQEGKDHTTGAMRKAAVSILSRNAHPLAILPVLLHVIEEKDLDALHNDCQATGMSSLQFAGHVLNALEKGKHVAAFSERSIIGIDSVTDFITEKECVQLWSKESGAIESAFTDSPPLFRFLWRTLSDPLNTSSPLSPQSVVKALDRTVPLSLHNHPFSTHITFASSSQRTAFVGNVSALWRLGPSMPDSTVKFVADCLLDYFAALQVGINLKALRWTEVYAVLLCLRFVSCSDAVGLATYLDLVVLLQRRLWSNSLLGPEVDEMVEYRPTTAATTGRTGRIGSADESGERLELVLALVRAADCFVAQCSTTSTLCPVEVAHHPLWHDLATRPWASLNLSADEKISSCSAMVAVVDAASRFLGSTAVSTGIQLVALSQVSHDDSLSSFYRNACRTLTNAMSCVSESPPLDMCIPLCSLIAALSEISAVRVVRIASSCFCDASPTSAMLFEQEALRLDSVHKSFASSFLEWEMALSIVSAVLAGAVDIAADAHIEAAMRSFAEATHWLCWNFVSMSSASYPQHTSVLPLILEEHLDGLSIGAMAEGIVLCLQRECTATVSAWRALGLLYHMLDLEDPDVVQHHMSLWVRWLSDESSLGDDAMQSLISFVVQQRVNVIIHCDINPLLDGVGALMRRAPRSGALVASVLLSSFDDASLLSDSQLQFLFLEMTHCLGHLIEAGRKERSSFDQSHSVAGTLAAVMRSTTFAAWVGAFPQVVYELRKLVQSTSSCLVITAKLLGASPALITTPSEVASCLQGLLMFPTLDALQEASQLIAGWARSNSNTWRTALCDFCTIDLFSAHRLHSICEVLRSPARHEALAFLQVLLNATHVCDVRSIAAAIQTCANPELLLFAVVWAVRGTDDRALQLASTLVHAGVNLLYNGPRVMLFSPPTDVVKLWSPSDASVPGFASLHGTIAKLLLTLDVAGEAHVGQLGLSRLLHALIFGPYVVDVSLPSDAAAVVDILSSLAAQLSNRRIHARAIVQRLLTMPITYETNISVASSARREVLAGIVSPGLQSIWVALSAVLSAKEFKIDVPTDCREWRGLLPSFC